MISAMETGLLYFAADVVALTAALLIGAHCLATNPRSLSARLFAGVMASAASYLLGRLSYAVPADVQVYFHFWPWLLILMNVGMGLWMILAYSLFQDERRVPRWMIAAFAIQLLLSAINAFGYVGRDSSVLQSATYPASVNFTFGPLPLAMQASFALLALYWTARGWRADLDESRRVLRRVFLLVFGVLSLGASIAELLLIDAPPSERLPVDNVITLVMAVGYLTIAFAALRFDHRVLDRLVERALPEPGTNVAFDRDLAALTRALDKEKVYLIHGLSISALAKRLTLPEYRLRALINKRLGYRNFNALLHDYRLRDACARLADPSKAHLPILTIALDVGYQSITPFNQAFRELVGCTPPAYRQQHTASV